MMNRIEATFQINHVEMLRMYVDHLKIDSNVVCFKWTLVATLINLTGSLFFKGLIKHYMYGGT